MSTRSPFTPRANWPRSRTGRAPTAVPSTSMSASRCSSGMRPAAGALGSLEPWRADPNATSPGCLLA